MLIGIATGVSAPGGPFILGQATVGARLSLSPVTLSGDSPLTYALQWLRDGSPISGATAAEYTSTEADVGTEITARLTLPDARQQTSSNAVRIAEPAPQLAPVITTPASVSSEDLGDAMRYRFVAPGVAGTAPITLTAQLTLDGVDVSAQMEALSYTATDTGTLRWRVSASNAQGSATAEASAAVSASLGSVDLSAATTSLRFPPGNSLAAEIPAHLKLALTQDTSGLPRPLTVNSGHATHHSAYVFAVRLPLAARRTDAPDTTAQYYLMGDEDHYINVLGNGSVFSIVDYQYGSQVTVPWETAVIFRPALHRCRWRRRPPQPDHRGQPRDRRSAGRCKDRYLPIAAWDGELRIGHTGKASAGPTLGPAPEEAWPGEIAWMAQVVGPLRARLALGADDPFKYLKRIAQGEDIQDVLYDIERQGDGWTLDPGPYMTFYRDFDGTAQSLSAGHVAAKPVPPENAASGNTTGPALRDSSADTTVLAGALAPGTDFLWRDGKLLTWRSIGVPGMATPPAPVPGYVRGLVPGAQAAEVAFGGTAVGYSGTVEIRLIYRDSGTVALDWTPLGTIADGQWSGTASVPKSTEGWLVTQFRIGGDIWNHRDIWGVGYKALQLGQSQTNIYLYGDARSHRHVAHRHGHGQPGHRQPSLSARAAGHGRQHEQFRRSAANSGAECAVMLLENAVNGTSQEALIDDSNTSRNWSSLQTTLDTWGNDISVVLKNWVTNEMNRTDAQFRDILDGMIKGTGTGRPMITVSMRRCSRAMSLPFPRPPATPAAAAPATSAAMPGNATSTRRTEADYAQSNAEANAHGLPDMIIGPPVSDFQIEDAGGPHQLVSGSMVMGARMAMTLVKAVGGHIPDQPVFTGTATLNPAGTQITVPVTLPNGGTLTAISPNAIRSFGVSSDGGSTWHVDGFTAAISGNAVVLTKDSGTWTTGNLRVKYYSNGRGPPERDRCRRRSGDPARHAL